MPTSLCSSPPPPSQVVVATAATCWGMTSAAHLVVVMGTQFFDASGSGSSDYPVTDLLQMMGRASRPNIDDSGKGGAGILGLHCPQVLPHIKRQTSGISDYGLHPASVSNPPLASLSSDAKGC